MNIPYLSKISLRLFSILAVSNTFISSTSLAQKANIHGSEAKKVLAESVRFVGFAPPEYTGTFKFQILEDGTVLSIDNKNNIKKLALLASSIKEGIQKNIATLPENIQLERPTDHPECMDAPSFQTLVYKANGKALLIAEQYNCISSINKNVNAQHLADWIENLQNALMNPPQKNEMQFQMQWFGQEGYGSPIPPSADPIEQPPKLEKVCRSKSPDLQGAVYQAKLFRKSVNAQTLDLILEKTFREQKSKAYYLVTETTDIRLLGSPQTFEGRDVKLSIQYTTTPRPDHLHNGSLVIKSQSGTHSNHLIIPLLCK